MDAHGRFYMNMSLNLENLSGDTQPRIKSSKFPPIYKETFPFHPESGVT